MTLNKAYGQQDYILLCTFLHERNKIFILEVEVQFRLNHLKICQMTMNLITLYSFQHL